MISLFVVVLIVKSVLCLVPITKILRHMRAGYMLVNVEVNHLLLMDDLKVFGKNEKETDSLIQLLSYSVAILVWSSESRDVV